MQYNVDYKINMISQILKFGLRIKMADPSILVGVNRGPAVLIDMYKRIPIINGS